jgi:hypothetical protein
MWLDVSQPYGLPLPVTGIALPFIFFILRLLNDPFLNKEAIQYRNDWYGDNKL